MSPKLICPSPSPGRGKSSTTSTGRLSSTISTSLSSKIRFGLTRWPRLSPGRGDFIDIRPGAIEGIQSSLKDYDSRRMLFAHRPDNVAFGHAANCLEGEPVRVMSPNLHQKGGPASRSDVRQHVGSPRRPFEVFWNSATLVRLRPFDAPRYLRSLV